MEKKVPMISDKGLFREIRISGYGDYAAIDYYEHSEFGVHKIVETPVYLKKGEERKCKIRWDADITNSSGSHDQSWMEAGNIKFDGTNFLLSYGIPNANDWWIAEDNELENWTFIHFK